MILTGFLVFLGLFLATGLASVRKARGNRKDYYIASQSVNPLMTGLSAVATNNSGYMFIGVIGYTYVAGLASIWLMFGWILGDFLASLFIHRKLRQATAATGEASFTAVIARWSGGDMAVWRRLAAVVTVVFLGAYAAAQIAAGGKALQGVLGWDPTAGAWLVAGMVLAYSIVGGIRASIWTDVAQSAVMIVAMAMLVFAAVSALGGVGPTVSSWAAIPGFLDLTPDEVMLPGLAGIGLFVIGWLFAGLSVIGQPHVMVRFMALDEAEHIVAARAWYYGFFIVFYALATLAGMLARLHLPELADLDPEMALPTMAVKVLSPLLVGVILAGIFAATMSTADSLVLSCSAAITHDLLPTRIENPMLMKLATGLVTALALGIALWGNSSVFDLVILAWSTLAVAFGPMLILLALGRPINEIGAIAMMVTGIGVALAWRWLGWHDMIYEGMPGIIAGLVVGLILTDRVALRGSPQQLLRERPVE
jgi:sodium/proline symporter